MRFKIFLIFVSLFLICLVSAQIKINEKPDNGVVISTEIIGEYSNATTNGTTYHNLFSGLQGGTATERYHIQESWYNELAIDIFNFLTQSDADLLYSGIQWNYNQTLAGNNLFLNLSGGNANQNINISNYNLSAGGIYMRGFEDYLSGLLSNYANSLQTRNIVPRSNISYDFGTRQTLYRYGYFLELMVNNKNVSDWLYNQTTPAVIEANNSAVGWANYLNGTAGYYTQYVNGTAGYYVQYVNGTAGYFTLYVNTTMKSYVDSLIVNHTLITFNLYNSTWDNRDLINSLNTTSSNFIKNDTIANLTSLQITTNLSIGNIFINGSSIGIGTTVQSKELEIVGTAKFSNSAGDNTLLFVHGTQQYFGFHAMNSSNDTAPIYWQQGGGLNVTTTFGLINGKMAINPTINFPPTNPTYDLSFGPTALRSIGVERYGNTSEGGYNLSIVAGGAGVSATNKYGGDLILTAGRSTGTGLSNIFFQVSPKGSSGTTDNLPVTKMMIAGNGYTGFNGVTSITSPAMFDVNNESTTVGAGNIIMIANSLAVTGNMGGIWFGQANSYGAGAGIMGLHWDRTGGARDTDIQFITTGNNVITEKMRLTSMGRLGIGVTAPAYNLEVGRNATSMNVSGILYVNTTNVIIGRLPIPNVDFGPSHLLSVYGAGNFSGTIYINNVTDISTFSTFNTTGNILKLISNQNITLENITSTKNMTISQCIIFGTGGKICSA